MWRNASAFQVVKGWTSFGRPRYLDVVPVQACRDSRRTFYASKWQKRLGHLLEGRRRPPPPDIPEKDRLSNDFEIKPCKPVLGSKRTGVLAYKIGCMSLWDEWGVKHMVTVCQLDRLHVLKAQTLQKEGYEALRLGLGYRSIHRINKSEIANYIKAGVGPKHHVGERRPQWCWTPGPLGTLMNGPKVVSSGTDTLIGW
eukprot:s1028_g9.t1